jgi:EAL domain-containing protein (putative c-di-GMP-specific phosphodiesterase class I)
VSPGEFIGVAEEMRLIVPIGMWILRVACEQAHRWNWGRPQEAPLTVSVNISARQFAHHELVTQVAEILQKTKAEPWSIKLELPQA